MQKGVCKLEWGDCIHGNRWCFFRRGIKGFALIGALAEIEKQGFQFKRVAGTSAGSIISALIIAGYSSDEIERMMDDLDLKVFLDSRKSLIPIAVAKWIFLFWSLGLYKGNELEKWIEARLAARGFVHLQTFPAFSTHYCIRFNEWEITRASR